MKNRYKMQRCEKRSCSTEAFNWVVRYRVTGSFGIGRREKPPGEKRRGQGEGELNLARISEIGAARGLRCMRVLVTHCVL